jgi:hypothetical protein
VTDADRTAAEEAKKDLQLVFDQIVEMSKNRLLQILFSVGN